MMVYGYGVKTPPQPLPTRGRGYDAALPHAKLILAVRRTITACEILAFDRHCGLRLSPSPLWGGVGEGFFSTHSEGSSSHPRNGHSA
ncbi:hypothetical protein CHY08_17440 [Rhizobium leguminosarum bv. viciae]|nr:hypothetical protein CHY08_17440 [Rhizobium leguminosarum bv. viciae]